LKNSKKDNKMKEIKVYKLADGTIIEDKKEALSKEEGAKIRAVIIEFTDRFFPVKYSDLSKYDIINMLVDHSEELYNKLCLLYNPKYN